MCDIEKTTHVVDFGEGKETVFSFKCRKTRKNAYICNEYGIFCEDMCDYDKIKEAAQTMQSVGANISEILR